MPRGSYLQLSHTLLLSVKPDMRGQQFYLCTCPDLPSDFSSDVRIRWLVQKIDLHVQHHKQPNKACAGFDHVLFLIHLR